MNLHAAVLGFILEQDVNVRVKPVASTAPVKIVDNKRRSCLSTNTSV